MLRGVHFQPTDSAVLHCFDVDFAEAGSEIEEECQWPSMTFFTASTATCLYRHLAAISSKWIKICSRSIPSGGTSYRFQQNFSRLKLVKRIATEKRHNYKAVYEIQRWTLYSFRIQGVSFTLVGVSEGFLMLIAFSLLVSH